MLPFDDPGWTELSGGYPGAYDPRDPLRRLERNFGDRAAWGELWQELHHQGDIGTAAYAAVPHLVRIAKPAARRDWNVYAMCACIEIERHRKTNPPMPEWADAAYRKAWRELDSMALADLGSSSDEALITSALAVAAPARGHVEVGALVFSRSRDETAEILDERNGWIGTHRVRDPL